MISGLESSSNFPFINSSTTDELGEVPERMVEPEGKHVK